MRLRGLLCWLGGVVVALMTVCAPALSETVLSVTQVSYDADDRPLCTAERMNPSVYGSLPSDACTLGTASPTYGNDRIGKTVYDAAGQATQIVQAYGTADSRVYSTLSYGNDGEVIDTIDANGNRSHNVHDGFNRLVTFNYPSTTRPSSYNPSTQTTALATAGAYSTTDYEAYTYDANGNRTSWRRRDAVFIYDCYDNLNRTVRESVGTSSCATSGGGAADVFTDYDGLGRIVWKSFVAKDNTPGVTYAYDGLGRMTSTTDMNGRTVSYLYNLASARTRVTWPNASYAGFTLDALNRITETTHSSGASLYSLSYNSLGQRTQLGRGGGVAATNYTYDAIGRLATFNDDLAGTANDITWTFSYSPASQVTSWSASSAVYDYKETVTTTVNQTYDGLNRDAAIAAVSGGYDARGNLTKDATRVLAYDEFNRLLTSAPVGTPTVPNVKLVYDPEGRLAKYSTDNGVTWTTFVYDGTDLIAEYDSSATPVLLRTYVHGPGDDEPVVWFEGPGYTFKHFLMPNYQSSTIATTDSSGNLEASYQYGAYGEPEVGKSPIGAWSGPRFRYTGQTMLFGAQLYYYKARVYDPIYGHFLQTDPIGTKDDLDLYSYTGDDPINRGDPSGTECVTSGKTTTCNPHVNGLPAVTFPTPKGWPSQIKPGDKDYHNYDKTVTTTGNEKKADSIRQGIVNAPTPGSGNKPASPTGTVNNATPPPANMVPGSQSMVKSYVVTDSSGNQVVINVTEPGHPLFPGYVERGVVAGPDGTLTVHNAGEGTGALQGPGSPVKDTIDNVWINQSKGIVDQSQ